MNNPYNLVIQLLDEISNQRTRDVIARRFGLISGRPATLQEIGDQYDITRERVRQIEKSGLDMMLKPEIKEKLKPMNDELFGYFKQYGDLRRETKAFDDLVCYCLPARHGSAEGAQEGAKDQDLCKAAINLLLTLGEPFSRLPEDDSFYTVWTVDKNVFKKAKKTVDSIVSHFSKSRELLDDQKIYQLVKKIAPGISDKATFSYIDASKNIEQNHFGQFGLIAWPEITPRGVRDKAYLVLRQKGKPFHFNEITNLINKDLPQSKPAYVQTVHNELIKDSRFVLIGRGIYALNEWGYEPGTVVDMIKNVLKEKGPFNKEEIVRQVLGKRQIKENTILINLQNKKYFKRLEDGRFSLV